MPNLGVTTYLWSLESQDLFLSQCLAPAVVALRREGLVSRFWFERMDSRGPHVFALLSVPEGAASAVPQRLADSIGSHLAAHPCTSVLGPEELRHRHGFCRGKVQGAADRLPGFAENNTFLICAHEERGFPFHLSAGLPAEEELWSLLTDLTLWAIEQSTKHSDLRCDRAMRWLAACDRSVRSSRASAEAYWRYHATTLLLPLAERLHNDEARVLAQIPAAIGAKNHSTFSRVWDRSEEEGASFPWIDRIASLVLDSSSPGETQRFALLRETIHCGLKQMGLPVGLQVPLVLFAWSRNLSFRSRSPELAIAG